MLKNYLTTALRSLWRSKASTFINISGLTLGVATSLILFLLVRHHNSFDSFHSKANRIYRVTSSSDGNQGKNYSAGVPAVFPDAFKLDFPEAEEVLFTSYWGAGEQITIPQEQGESKRYNEEKGIVYTQPNYFKVFDRKILIGDGEKGLEKTNAAVISKSMALKYFGKEDAIGRILIVRGKEFKVEAIAEDYPSNTDFPFDVILSYITIKKEQEENGWHSIWSDQQCFFLLKEGHRVDEIEKGIPAFVKKYHGENINHTTYEMQPLSQVHFDERFGNYNYDTISRQMLLALSIIGIFLIITACINFINLVTAEAIKRSKEVGIRKTLGSSRTQLIIQFLGESSLVTAIAVLLAIGVAQLALSFLNPFLKLDLALNFSQDGTLWIFLISVTAFVAFFSGLYPSLVVSGFKPVFAIKNQINNKNSSSYFLRQGLVVLQFFISQGLIIGTIVLITQMNYFKNKDLGFRRDAIITVPLPELKEGMSKVRTLREEVSRLKGVEQASLSNTAPSSGSVWSTDFQVEGKDEHFGTQIKLIDGKYLELYGLELVAGSNVLDLDTAQGFVVNEKLASLVGYNDPKEIIGKTIRMWGKTLPVIGVVKNFHTMSLREPIEATIMLNQIGSYSILSLKINQAGVSETVEEIKQKWEAAYPEHIFSYQFLDEQIQEFYEREQKMSMLLTLFTGLAIFIGCLGLFGLATFMANQKTKEVGVRKVLGASVESIIILFSKEYVKLIVIGFLFAAPAAWYIMTQWLDTFTYKIKMGPSIFAVGLAITFFIAIATVGYRSFKTAMANPAKSLRSE